MATQAYFMKQETLTNLHLKEPETEPKTIAKKKKKSLELEGNKMRAETNEIKTKTTIEKINET